MQAGEWQETCKGQAVATASPNAQDGANGGGGKAEGGDKTGDGHADCGVGDAGGARRCGGGLTRAIRFKTPLHVNDAYELITCGDVLRKICFLLQCVNCVYIGRRSVGRSVVMFLCFVFIFFFFFFFFFLSRFGECFWLLAACCLLLAATNLAQNSREDISRVK